MQFVTDGGLDAFDTIIWDTAKDALDDFLVAFVIEGDYRLKTNTLKMYGKIAEEFKIFLNICRTKCLDLLIIAHAKSQEQGDNVKQIANVTGQSNSLLYQVCDQMGYVTTKNGQVVIDFQRNDNFLTKNVAALTQLTLPHYTSTEWDGYAEREIFAPVRTALTKMTDEQERTLDFIQGWRLAIDAIEGSDQTTGDELLTTMKAIGEIKEDHLKKQITPYFIAHYKKIGFKYVKESNTFVPVVAKPAETPPATPPANQAPPAEQQAPPAPGQSESNPNGLLPKASTPSIAMPNSEAAMDDLFRNVEE